MERSHQQQQEKTAAARTPLATSSLRSSSAQQRRLIRAVVLTDGVVVACFRVGPHATRTLVLEASGHTYTYMRSDGRLESHITTMAPSRQCGMVIDAVRLRNQFLPHTTTTALTPYVHVRLCTPHSSISSNAVVQQPRLRSVTNTEPLRVRWPTQQLYNIDKLFDKATQRLELQSIDGNARVQLHASGTLVDAFFRVVARQSINDDPDDIDDVASVPHDVTSVPLPFVTVHQTFTPASAPQCFAYAVALLQHVRRQIQHNRNCTHVDAPPAAAMPSARSYKLPTSAAFRALATFTALPVRGASSTATGAGGASSLTRDDAERVASCPSRQLLARVAVEVRDDATFIVESRAANSVVPSVIVQLAGRSAVIECTGAFFRWFRDRDMRGQQFIAETMPPLSAVASTSDHPVNLEPLCNHALDLIKWRHLAATAAAAAIDTSAADTLDTADAQPLATDVVERAVTSDGQFRAFADGRVRVVFADRTLFCVDATATRCSVTQPDGTVANGLLLTALPSTLEPYADQALAFRDWAFTSPAERLVRHEERRHRAAATDLELRKLNVRIRLNDGQYSDDDVNSTQDDVVACDSIVAIAQLQDATQRHIARVTALLDAPAIP